MTIKQLIKALKKFEQRGLEVVIDVQHMNRNMGIDEWTHRGIEGMDTEMISHSDDDGWLKENSEHLVLALKIN